MLLGGIGWLRRISHRYFLPIGQGQARGPLLGNANLCCVLQPADPAMTQDTARTPVFQFSSFR